MFHAKNAKEAKRAKNVIAKRRRARSDAEAMAQASKAIAEVQAEATSLRALLPLRSLRETKCTNLLEAQIE